MYPTYEEFWEYPGEHMDFEKMEDRYEDLSKRTVADVMSSPVVTVAPDTPILKVASLLIRKRIRRVPVVDGDKVVGIVSQGDIHQAIFVKECAL
jgi:CBS domain-containing protein